MSATETGITIDYKGLVLEMVDGDLYGIPRANRTMLELRLTLFVAAATSADTEAEECLVPFPPCFFNPATKVKDVWALQDYIRLIPPLDNLNSETELPPLVWELLYWVFTNPLTITPLFETNMNMTFLSEAEMTKVYEAVKAKTKLELPLKGMKSFWCMGMSFSPSSRERFIFEVETANPKPEFVEGKKKYGTYFAFHGSSLHNFHSIIHRGLCCGLNKRSAHGVGTYFSANLSTAKTYSLSGPSWKHSVFGSNLRCVAICEIVDAPEGIAKYEKEFSNATISVVADDNLIQLTYLIMFAPAYTAWNKTRKEMETSSGD